MEGYSRKDEIRPQLLDLIPKGKEWLLIRSQEEKTTSEEKKLELRLRPPGEEEDWTMRETVDDSSSLLSLGYFSNITAQNTTGSKRGFLDTKTLHEESSWNDGNQTRKFSNTSTELNPKALLSSAWSPNSQYRQGLPPVMGKESLLHQHTCSNKAVVVDLQNAEKKRYSAASVNNTAVPNSSQKSTAPAPSPVVGWPPIRSFRKNLASSSSSKLPPVPELQHVVPKKIAIEKKVENCCKGLFVKINMDGVPIGRKVDLKAYDSYEKLSFVVDELFRGLLAAQRDPSAGKIQNHQEGKKAITGLLDGSGEYTLVYEDNEGDRMLVGDVPWHMFVSTVKRLRVLKSSELSSLFSW